MTQEYQAGMTSEEATASLDTGSVEVDVQAQSDLNQARSFEATARHLTERNQTQKTEVGAGNFEAEERLSAIQLQLHRHNTGAQQLNPLEHMKLQAQAEVIAARLVGDYAPSDKEFSDSYYEEQTEPSLDDSLSEADQHVRNTIENVDEVLQYAADNLSEGTVHSWNAVLSGDNAEDRVAAAKILEKYHQNPEVFSEASSTKAFTSSQIQQIENEVGAELCDTLSTINAALANGVAKPQEVARMFWQDPKLMRAARTLAQKGLMNIAI